MSVEPSDWTVEAERWKTVERVFGEDAERLIATKARGDRALFAAAMRFGREQFASTAPDRSRLNKDSRNEGANLARLAEVVETVDPSPRDWVLALLMAVPTSFENAHDWAHLSELPAKQALMHALLPGIDPQEHWISKALCQGVFLTGGLGCWVAAFAFGTSAIAMLSRLRRGFRVVAARAGLDVPAAVDETRRWLTLSAENAERASSLMLVAVRGLDPRVPVYPPAQRVKVPRADYAFPRRSTTVRIPRLCFSCGTAEHLTKHTLSYAHATGQRTRWSGGRRVRITTTASGSLDVLACSTCQRLLDRTGSFETEVGWLGGGLAMGAIASGLGAWIYRGPIERQIEALTPAQTNLVLAACTVSILAVLAVVARAATLLTAAGTSDQFALWLGIRPASFDGFALTVHSESYARMFATANPA